MPQRRTAKDRARRVALADQAAYLWPDPPSATPQDSSPPIDTETMRESARRLLAENAEPPSLDELETLTLQLRGHIELAIPEVEAAAARLDEDDIPRACALAGIREARMRLNLEAGPTLHSGIAHAQRLARSVSSLCDHYESLGHGA